MFPESNRFSRITHFLYIFPITHRIRMYAKKMDPHLPSTKTPSFLSISFPYMDPSFSLMIPTGKLLQFANWKITMLWMGKSYGKSTVNGHFSIAMVLWMVAKSQFQQLKKVVNIPIFSLGFNHPFGGSGFRYHPQ